MSESNKLKYALSLAILKSLLRKQLISMEEMKKIDEKNKTSFGITT
jgi:hypothetical protein